MKPSGTGGSDKENRRVCKWWVGGPWERYLKGNEQQDGICESRLYSMGHVAAEDFYG